MQIRWDAFGEFVAASLSWQAAETHFFSSVFGHLSPVRHVTFVAQDHLLHIRGCMLAEIKMFMKCYMCVTLRRKWNLSGCIFRKTKLASCKTSIFFTYLFNVSNPVFDVFKGFLVADVVDKHNALWEETANTWKQFLWLCHICNTGTGWKTVLPSLLCSKLLWWCGTSPARQCPWKHDKIVQGGYVFWYSIIFLTREKTQWAYFAHQICSLTRFPSSSIVLILKSIPEHTENSPLNPNGWIHDVVEQS